MSKKIIIHLTLIQGEIIMPNNTIAIPTHRNSFFIASILGLLLPILDKGPMIKNLFGQNIESDKINALEEELEHCYLHIFPHLNQLINLHLRPRLAHYIRENTSNFSEHPPQNLLQRATFITEGTLACGPIEIQAFSLLTNTKIQVAASLEQPDIISEYGLQNAQNTIKIYYAHESNAVAITPRGYKRHFIPGDGDCCFTAFGVHRQTAYSLLENNLRKIISFIQPLLDAELLMEKFYNYLKAHNIIAQDIAFDVFSNNREQHLKDQRILRAYLKYDIIEREVSNGWGHPGFLQALARLLRVNLRIWEKNSSEQLQPLSEYASHYACYISDDNHPWIDLLYISNNHFDRLELIGYDSVPQNAVLTPIAQQLNSSCHVNIDPSVLSDELGRQLQLFSVVKEDTINQNIIDITNQAFEEISSYIGKINDNTTITARNSYSRDNASMMILSKKKDEKENDIVHSTPALLNLGKNTELLTRVDLQDAKRDLMNTSTSDLMSNDTPWNYFTNSGTYGLIGTGVGTVILGGEWLLSIPILSSILPVEITFAACGLAYGLAGKHFTERLKKTLLAANQKIDTGLSRKDDSALTCYGEAMALLEQEYNDSVANFFRYFQTTDGARSFLSFCLGICSNLRGAYLAAYEKYEEANLYAKKANNPTANLLTTLLKIELLKKNYIAIYSDLTEENSKTKAQSEIDVLSKYLSTSFTPALTDLYWSIFDRTIEISNMCQTYLCHNNPITPHNMDLIHHFMQFDNFFLLKHYSNEQGSYIEVLGTSVQALLLATISLKNIKIAPAHCSISPYEIPITRVVEKFEQCNKKINQFRNNYPSSINNNEDIKNSLLFIEKFILDFYTHLYLGKTINEQRYYALTTALTPHSFNLSSRYQLLSTLKEEFSMSYPSIENWLDSITPSSSLLVSQKTGDNMLHMLVKLKTGDMKIQDSVHIAAKKLVSLCDTQNLKKESPYSALNQSDPFKVKTILDNYKQELAVANTKKQALLPEFIFLDQIKVVIIGHIDTYLSHKPSEKYASYKKNVISSLDIIFKNDIFRQHIVDNYRKISSVSIPPLREKNEYLVSLVVYNAELIQAMYRLVKENPISNANSPFSEKVATYICNPFSPYIIEDSSNETEAEKDLLLALQARMTDYFQQYKPTVIGGTYSALNGKNRLTNVINSLQDGVFNHASRREEMVRYYRSIDVSRIPNNESMETHLLNLVTQDSKKIEALYKLSMEKQQDFASQFATDVVQYIKDDWQSLISKNVSITGNILLGRHRNSVFFSGNTVNQGSEIILVKVDQKMKIFKSAFLHFILKTYSLFSALLNESVQRKKDDAITAIGDALKSTQIIAGVNVPFVGKLDVNIPSVIAGILDLFVMANEYLDKQKMRHFYDVFSSDETQRFNEIVEAALKLSVELSPELYHMPEASITTLAEIASKRIINYITYDTNNIYSQHPSFVQKTKAHLFGSKPTTAVIRKSIIQICQEGMRSHMGSGEHSTISKPVGDHNSPTYEAILDYSGWIVAQKNGVTFIPAKNDSRAFCMALTYPSQVAVSNDRKQLPERLQQIVDICSEVYKAEMNNNHPVIFDDIFSHRRQHMIDDRIAASV